MLAYIFFQSRSFFSAAFLIWAYITFAWMIILNVCDSWEQWEPSLFDRKLGNGSNLDSVEDYSCWICFLWEIGGGRMRRWEEEKRGEQMRSKGWKSKRKFLFSSPRLNFLFYNTYLPYSSFKSYSSLLIRFFYAFMVLLLLNPLLERLLCHNSPRTYKTTNKRASIASLPILPPHSNKCYYILAAMVFVANCSILFLRCVAFYHYYYYKCIHGLDTYTKSVITATTTSTSPYTKKNCMQKNKMLHNTLWLVYVNLAFF